MRKVKAMADENLLTQISKELSQSMDRIMVSMHNPVQGVCPSCGVAAPCKPWQEAKGRLLKDSNG
jgi:hypothetical protein